MMMKDKLQQENLWNTKNVLALVEKKLGIKLDQWQNDLNVGLTGAFLCSQILGAYMAKRKLGVILNIASDLGVIAPDQRIYRKKGLKEDQQSVKPVTYSVAKHGLVGLTKYCATYWATQGVRVNALCPGGISAGQPKDFVKKLTNLIPLGRMAEAALAGGLDRGTRGDRYQVVMHIDAA